MTVQKKETVRIGSTKYSIERLKFQVQEQWTSTSGKRIVLPVVRIRNHGSENCGTLFYLTGGPGASNLSVSAVPKFLRDSFDTVLVGYRGVDTHHELRFPSLRRALSRFTFLKRKTSMSRTLISFEREIARLQKQSISPQFFGIDQVVEDLEFVRAELKIDNARVYSVSYGTRVALLWSAKYPSKIVGVVQEAVNPPGRFVWEPHDINATWMAIDRLWSLDSNNSGSETVPSKLVLGVLSSMPKRWGLLELDRGRIEAMLFGLLFNIDNLPLILSTFQKAKAGNFSGLGALSALFPLVVRMTVPFAGDFYLKGLVDFDMNRDYQNELLSDEGFSSYLGFAIWSWLKESSWTGFMSEQPNPKVTVPTLLLSGELDFSTPHKYAQTEMRPLCTHPTMILVRGAGHMNIVESDNEAVVESIMTFLSGVSIFDAEFSRTSKDSMKLNLSAIGWLIQILSLAKKAIPATIALFVLAKCAWIA